MKAKKSQPTNNYTILRQIRQRWFPEPQISRIRSDRGQNFPAFSFETSIAESPRFSGPEIERENSLSTERLNLDVVMLLNLEGPRRCGLG